MTRRHLFATLLALALAASTVLSAPTKFDIDANHSNVGFSVPILGGLSRVRGKFTDFAVTIVYDEADIKKSSVNAVIKATSIDTGVERRDAHLRNADFFEVEKYPEITFQSQRIEKRGKQFIAHGTFTMHGVSKEIALPFNITGINKTPDGKTTLGVNAQLVINRRDYGINWANKQNPSFVGDMVEIELNLITRAAAKQ